MWWRFIAEITNEYKILRGMISYSALWPLGCILQQTFEGKRWHNYDWQRCLRYSLYGTFVSAPMLYTWMRVANIMWPRTDVRGWPRLSPSRPRTIRSRSCSSSTA
uniref:(northern house mosquito) hypothetical protein n=1 Tax=Culex pipiens TaxID=7175 RepID=A0A8D7ZUG4_CULPI